MSFGSIIKGSSMPKENKDVILKVFARFPQYDFIWKWEEELPNTPKNVLGLHYDIHHQLSAFKINFDIKKHIPFSFRLVTPTRYIGSPQPKSFYYSCWSVINARTAMPPKTSISCTCSRRSTIECQRISQNGSWSLCSISLFE